MPTAENAAGVLVIDKPSGPTSHDVVACVRRLLGERRVGHAGTLDPFATGVLVCCVGKATRLARFFSACVKTYTGVIRFGSATDTGDRTGRALAEPVAVEVADDAVEAAARALTGEVSQVPPMYSAKKRGGVALHRMARRGVEVPRDPVVVRVEAFVVEPRRGDDVAFGVTCSAGTYVRVLGALVGERVGCPAHVAELRRTASGSFTLAHARRLEDLAPGSARAALTPLSDVPLPLASVGLADASEVAAFAHGQTLPPSPAEVAPAGAGPGAHVAVRGPGGELLGVALVLPSGMLRPDVVLVDP
jgi:tRNA pseudouridine55 synthase